MRNTMFSNLCRSNSDQTSVGPATTGLLAILLVAMCSAASAATRTWPTTAPCDSGTLQACINGAAAGDTVQIATNAPINESLSIVRSLQLIAAPSFKPRFADLAYVFASGSSGALNITYRGLTLQGGSLRVSASGSFVTTVVIEDNQILEGSNPSASFIRVERTSGALLDFRISSNRIAVGSNSGAEAAIKVVAAGPSDGRIDFNQISGSGNASGAGISFQGVPNANFETRIHNNQVVGNFGRNAFEIYLSTDTASLPTTTLVHLISNQASCRRSAGGFPGGIKLNPGSGHLDVRVINNTVVNCHIGVQVIDSSTPGGPQSVDGVLTNNLVAFNDIGFFLNPAYKATVDGHYNLTYRNDADYPPTTNTNQITSNPKIHNFQHPWPIEGSPAIDAGDAVSAQLYILLADAPQLDANGLRRTIRTGANGIDIGAFEVGDRMFARVKSGGGASNNFALANSATVGNSQANPQLSKVYNPAGVAGASNPSTMGMWWFANDWYPFNQNLSAMPDGAGFHVLSAGRNGSFGVNTVHVATPANIVDHYTKISDTFLNGTDDALLLAMSNFSGSGTGTYNNHLIATGFVCGSPAANCWVVMNLDGASMPVNAAFNLYAQPQSPNAFVHVATSSHSNAQYTYIDHPLLNGTPCAAPIVGEKLTTLSPHQFQLLFAGGANGQWAIYTPDGSAITGKQFYVLVDPKQVDECLHGFFSDGFEW